MGMPMGMPPFAPQQPLPNGMPPMNMGGMGGPPPMNGGQGGPPGGFTPLQGPPVGGNPGIHPDRMRMLGT